MHSPCPSPALPALLLLLCAACCCNRGPRSDWLDQLRPTRRPAAGLARCDAGGGCRVECVLRVMCVMHPLTPLLLVWNGT